MSTYDPGNSALSDSVAGTSGFSVLNAANKPYLTVDMGDASSGIFEVELELIYAKVS